jgi:hypothetical protein
MSWNKHEKAETAVAHLKSALADFLDDELRLAFAAGCERGAFEMRVEGGPEWRAMRAVCEAANKLREFPIPTHPEYEERQLAHHDLWDKLRVWDKVRGK